MDSEIRAIRRERWLQSQKESQESERTQNRTYEQNVGNENISVRVNISVDSSDGDEEVTIISDQFASKATESKQGSPQTKRKRRKRREQQQTSSSVKKAGGLIDLTLSDDSDENEKPSHIPPSSTKRNISNFESTASSSSSSTTTARRIQMSSDLSSSSPYISSFSLCTYNVWFGPPHQSKRMAEIASSLLTHKPALVGLQEVTPELGEGALFPLLRSRGGYHIISQDLDGGVGYGCAVAVDTNVAQIVDSGFCKYRNTIMDRGFVWVHARISPACTQKEDGGGGNDDNDENKAMYVLFTTTHLESYVRNYPAWGQNYEGVKERKDQIRQMTEFCEKYMSEWKDIGAAFVTGDLNWDDERKKSTGKDECLLSIVNGRDGNTNSKIGSSEHGKITSGNSSISSSSGHWVDAWLKTRPAQEGYTYDAKINPMLGGNLRRRFDRCLTLTRQPSVQNTIPDFDGLPKFGVTSTKMIGTDPIEGLEWKKEIQQWGKSGGTGRFKTVPVLPSDHYGLLVTFGDDGQNDINSKDFDSRVKKSGKRKSSKAK